MVFRPLVVAVRYRGQSNAWMAFMVLIQPKLPPTHINFIHDSFEYINIALFRLHNDSAIVPCIGNVIYASIWKLIWNGLTSASDDYEHSSYLVGADAVQCCFCLLAQQQNGKRKTFRSIFAIVCELRQPKYSWWIISTLLMFRQRRKLPSIGTAADGNPLQDSTYTRTVH